MASFPIMRPRTTRPAVPFANTQGTGAGPMPVKRGTDGGRWGMLTEDEQVRVRRLLTPDPDDNLDDLIARLERALQIIREAQGTPPAPLPPGADA